MEEKKTGIEVREMAEAFYDQEYLKTTDEHRRRVVSSERETWIACWSAGYRSRESEPQPGPAWVKEADIEIVKEKIYCVRSINKGFGHIYHSLFVDINGARWVDGQVNSRIELEVLDEGTAAGREEDALSKEVIDFIRDIAENWDCDEDGHKYNTGCRKCSASELYYELSKQQKDK